MEAGDERRSLLRVSKLQTVCYLSIPYPHSLHDDPE